MSTQDADQLCDATRSITHGHNGWIQSLVRISETHLLGKHDAFNGFHEGMDLICNGCVQEEALKVLILANEVGSSPEDLQGHVGGAHDDVVRPIATGSCMRRLVAVSKKTSLQRYCMSKALLQWYRIEKTLLQRYLP